MKKFKVTFRDEIEAESEEEAYKNILNFCAMVYNSSDVTAFKFEEVLEDGNGHEIKMPVTP
jgi:thermostable 8-oxoguanine DNA glycosylase